MKRSWRDRMSVAGMALAVALAVASCATLPKLSEPKLVPKVALNSLSS